MITGPQIRRAREMLGLSAAQLALAAKVDRQLIDTAEMGGATTLLGETELARIRGALEAHGIGFIDNQATFLR